MTRPMSEYFANDPECHDLLPCALRSHRVAGFGGCPTGPPVDGVTSTSTPALWPCAVLWLCTFCSDRSTILPVVGYAPQYLRFLLALLNAHGGLLFSDVVRSFICDTRNGVCISETENKRVV